VDFDRVIALFSALQVEGVEYVLVGGIAVNLHGILRATEDVDLFVRAEAGNVDRLKAALKAVFDDPHIEEISLEDLAGDYPTVRYIPPSDDFVIDVLSRLGEGVAWEDLEAETISVNDVDVRVATPRTLIRMKRDTIRHKDRDDAEKLRAQFGIEDE
jgi:hypothetical protein